jgi:hypothetical protein
LQHGTVLHGTFSTATTGDLLQNDNNSIVYKFNGTTWVQVGKAPWLIGLNAGVTNPKFGTSNNTGLGIYTNNTQRLGIGNAGAFTFNSLSGTGNVLMGLSSTGLASRITLGSNLSLSGSTLNASGGGSSLFPLTGTGTATGNVTGDLNGHNLSAINAGNIQLTSDDTVGISAVNTYSLNSLDSGYVLATNALFQKGGYAHYLALNRAFFGSASSSGDSTGITTWPGEMRFINVPAYSSGTGKFIWKDGTSNRVFAKDITASDITGISATAPITYSSGAISTSMSTGKLIGRSTSGTGVMEEITVGSGLALSGGTLSSSAATPTLTSTQIAFGDGSNLMTSSANLKYASSVVTANNSNIGTTRADGLVLQNTQAATSGQEQISPSLVLEGRTWLTTAGGSSNANKWSIFNRTQQNISTVASSLVFQSTNNAGTYADVMTLSGQSAPVLTVAAVAAATSVTTPSFPSNASGFWTWGSGTKLFGGTTYTLQLGEQSNIVSETGYKLDAYGAIAGSGTINSRQLTTPVISSATTGTAGSTTITYKVVAVDAAGNTTDAGSTTISTANATLTTSNFVTITGTAIPGIRSYKLYRTATNGTAPTTTGLIATTTQPGSSGIFFTDKGTVAGGGEVPPTVNTTGTIQGSYYKMTSYTSAQISALTTMVAGDTVYCSDCTAVDASTGVVETYNGSSWKKHW